MISEINQVIVLCNGYSRMLGGEKDVMEANCTCTLIRTKTGVNIIIDTMDCWSGPKILSALETHDLSPKDISFCISTHGHCDHLGNNNLFLDATHIVGETISKEDQYFYHNFSKEPYKITEDIEVISTKGHTLTCVTVIVKNTNHDSQTIGIVGDLFESYEDINDPSLWRSAGTESPGDQEKNRLRVAEMVDIIIPGHGPLFSVTQEIREKLKPQMS